MIVDLRLLLVDKTDLDPKYEGLVWRLGLFGDRPVKLQYRTNDIPGGVWLDVIPVEEKL